MIFLFALVIIPLIELAVIISLASWIGIWPTVFILIAGAVVGLILLKREGVVSLGAIRQSRERGEVPTREVADTILVGLAAPLLLFPGLVTDMLAFLLLVPGIRAFISKRFLKTEVIHAKITARRQYDIEGEAIEEISEETVLLEEKAAS